MTYHQVPWLAILALVVLGLWWAHLRFWSRKLSLKPSYALEERLRMPDGLRCVNVPACFFAGTRDLLAPTELVRAAHDAWGADQPDLEKRFLVRENSGHGDFAFGSAALEDVYVPALAFLDTTTSVQRLPALGSSLPTP
jgi:hypothetical protein